MRRRASAFLVAFSAAVLACASASEVLAQLRAEVPDRPGFRVDTVPFGLRLTTPAFGLRVEFFPPRGEAGAQYEYVRHEPYRSVPFSLGAPPAPGLRFSSAQNTGRRGWDAFGSFGPLRWAKTLDEDSDMTLRFGGRPGGPDRLNFGFQYRF